MYKVVCFDYFVNVMFIIVLKGVELNSAPFFTFKRVYKMKKDKLDVQELWEKFVPQLEKFKEENQ